MSCQVIRLYNPTLRIKFDLPAIMSPHAVVTDFSLSSTVIDEEDFTKAQKPRHEPTKNYDIERYRKLVPVASQEGTTYLNASIQPTLNSVAKSAIDQFLCEGQNSPCPKTEWVKRAEVVRELLGRYLNVASETLAFTRDTTEALNLFQRSLKIGAGDNVVVLDVEHPNHTYGWLALAEDREFDVRQVSTKDQELFADASTFRSSIDDRTRAIGISSIMFHSGQHNDVADICSNYRDRGIHVLADMTQEVGVGPVDLKKTNVSAAAFSCHKAFGCPAGLGVLYIAPDVLDSLKPIPPVVGAGAIANLSPDLLVDASAKVRYHGTTRRYEHLNISMIGIHALQASLKFFMDDIGMGEIEAHLRTLGKKLTEEANALGVKVAGSIEDRKHSPHLYVLQLLDPAWQKQFESVGIVASYYRLGIRISFGFYNDLSDVEVVINAIKAGIEAGISLT